MHQIVTIIILTWNAQAYTRKCLATLGKRTDLSRHEVVVVDNGSTDGTVEFLETLDWIRLIKNRRNLGFVRGANLGIAASDQRSDILLLNNDVEIYQAGWLEQPTIFNEEFAKKTNVRHGTCKIAYVELYK